MILRDQSLSSDEDQLLQILDTYELEERDSFMMLCAASMKTQENLRDFSQLDPCIPAFHFHLFESLAHDRLISFFALCFRKRYHTYKPDIRHLLSRYAYMPRLVEILMDAISNRFETVLIIA